MHNASCIAWGIREDLRNSIDLSIHIIRKKKIGFGVGSHQHSIQLR